MFIPEPEFNWLVVSTHLEDISQLGNLPQVGMNLKPSAS